MKAGRVLGLDPGDVRVGVAVSDPVGIIASPHSVLDTRDKELGAALKRLCDENEVITIVIGLPVSLDGTEGPAAVKAREFGRFVEQAVGMTVAFHDERFTTVTAEAALLESGMKRGDRKAVRDKVAAAVMLQGFLDSR